MQNNNPFRECFGTIQNWDVETTFWSDQYYGIYLQNKGDLMTHQEYLENEINGLINSAFEDAVRYLNDLVSGKDRMNFISDVFDLSDSLVEESYRIIPDGILKNYFLKRLKELNRKLHQKFDDDLYSLLDKNSTIEDKAKIKFNLNRTELTHFLLHLKDSNIINNSISDYALALLASKYFLCAQGEDKIPSQLKGIEKFIHEIRKNNQYSSDVHKTVKKKVSEGDIFRAED